MFSSTFCSAVVLHSGVEIKEGLILPGYSRVPNSRGAWRGLMKFRRWKVGAQRKRGEDIFPVFHEFLPYCPFYLSILTQFHDKY